MSVTNHSFGGIKYIEVNLPKLEEKLIPAISPINSYCDPEYLRILQELMRLGIAPSGDKNIDKAKLQQAKAELLQKNKEQNRNENNQNFQLAQIDKYENPEREKLEELRPGAMTVAELNRFYFGI